MKTVFFTSRGAKGKGPYATATLANGFVFISGQGPIDPETGDIVRGDIDKQIRRALDNILIVLSELGLDFRSIVKMNVFLRNIEDFEVMNSIFTEYFGDSPAARSALQAGKLPFDIGVEIDATAIVES